MAKITMNYDFDFRQINFGVTDDFQRFAPTAGTNFSYATPLGAITGPMTAMYYDGDTTATFEARTSLVGSAFAYNALGVATAGTLTGLVHTIGFDAPSAPLDFTISGMNVGLVAFQTAAKSASLTDDVALFKSILIGDDTIDGSGGDDYIYASSGNDILSGNAGADTLLGEAGNDFLYGGLGKDSLVGGEGADVLYGMTGDDKLFGGDGADFMTGGMGKDALYGGGGTDVDTFIYTNVRESTANSLCDSIYNFNAGIDKVNLSAIDANKAMVGNQAFAYSEATPAAYSLWYKISSANTLIYADTNGDAIADFALIMKSVTTLTATDFIL